MASNRTFGLFFAALFALGGAWIAWNGSPWAAAAFAAAGLLGGLALRAPDRLAPANRAWHALGLLLARVVNPVVMAALFFLVITPMGWLMRAFGKRPLALRFEPHAATYWIERTPRGPAPGSMKDPF